MGIGRIALNLEMVREKVKNRCLKNAIDPSRILIVGITKSHPAGLASEAVAAGLTDLGENKVQEASEKISQVEPRPRWHLVGHLQTNKVKKAVEIFDVIQSVDSLEVAEAISSVAGRTGKTMEIYLQVNSSGEHQKSGFQPGDVVEAAKNMVSLPNLNITGLMTIGPMTENVELIKKSFGLTQALFERIQSQIGENFNKLSMGMTGDYELALDYGANVLRIGTAIFGPRE